MFNKGDVVAYTSGRHGDAETNPSWGGIYGKVKGVVTELEGPQVDSYAMVIRVKWVHLNTDNLYSPVDLSLMVNDGGRFVSVVDDDVSEEDQSNLEEAKIDKAKEDLGQEIKIKGLFNVGG